MLLAVLFVPRASADAPINPVPPLETPEQIAVFVRAVQREHNLPDIFFDTLKEESAGFQNIQSEVPDPSGPNGRENSWGICQINLDPTGHPEFTRAQAMDVRWCVEWSAEQFEAGNAWQWTEYRLLTASSSS